MRNFYAHSIDNTEICQWQTLKEHLENTAKLAASFAGVFGAKDAGYLAGMLHDIGKYSLEFQKRLAGENLKVDHSTAGAREAFKMYGPFGKLLAYVIAGHHCGLLNGGSPADETSLEGRLKKSGLPDYRYFQKEIDLNAVTALQIPFKNYPSGPGFSAQFFIRFLYSALVDADFLDTEQAMNPEQSKIRNYQYSLPELVVALDKYIHDLMYKAADTAVNKHRKKVFNLCKEKATFSPGFFTLTVPTGGGKTLSSLAFALHHAIRFGMERIIYIIPYTSIIEQNAAVFREVIGFENVLEHHSNFVYPKTDYEENEWEYDSNVVTKLKLAAENWDMPVITSTNVQFFESLFAARSSQCRKLHNIANSVIILDEAQMIPTNYLQPCISALIELITNYNCTVLLCTATQPAIKKFIPKGINTCEIINDPNGLYKALRRVQVISIGEVKDDQLAIKILENEQVLCIVNSKKHARIIFGKIKTDDTFHLSSRMCPIHRSKVLEEIKSRLKINKPCRVIATQLIEAGVDVDFPVVYRSSAGIDSIAQAAGRCNREGRRETGSVFVFQPEKHGLPAGWLSRTATIGNSVLRRYQDPLSLEAIQEYFLELYDIEGDNLDASRIMSAIREQEQSLNFPLREIADKFKIITENTIAIIVPFDENCEKILVEAEWSPNVGKYLRKLQGYTVQVYESEFKEMLQFGMVKSIKGSFYILTREAFNESYSFELGLLPVTESMLLKDTLVI